MNTIWKTVIGLSALIVAANCLSCHQCSVGIFGSCLFGSDTTCANSTESCYTGEALVGTSAPIITRMNHQSRGFLSYKAKPIILPEFNATGSLTLHTRGCVNSYLCGLTLTGSLLGAPYTSTYKCCVTDLCNGATSVQLSAALYAAILSPLWGFWEL